MESTTLQILINGGLASVALFSLWIIWKLSTNHDRHMLDAIDRNTGAWNENTKALQKLCDMIELRK